MVTRPLSWSHLFTARSRHQAWDREHQAESIPVVLWPNYNPPVVLEKSYFAEDI